MLSVIHVHKYIMIRWGRITKKNVDNTSQREAEEKNSVYVI